MSGKDGDGIKRISLYLIEYQKIKIPLKNNGLSEYMFHFLGEILVAVTGEI